MDKTEFCEALRVHIALKHKRQSIAARAWGVSESYLSQVLKGTKTPTAVMLKESGYERIQPEAYFKKMKKKASE